MNNKIVFNDDENFFQIMGEGGECIVSLSKSGVLFLDHNSSLDAVAKIFFEMVAAEVTRGNSNKSVGFFTDVKEKEDPGPLVKYLLMTQNDKINYIPIEDHSEKKLTAESFGSITIHR